MLVTFAQFTHLAASAGSFVFVAATDAAMWHSRSVLLR